MLLLNITSITNIRTTFNVSFALLAVEDEEAFNLAISALKAIYVKASISKPSILLIDFEVGLKNAL